MTAEFQSSAATRLRPEAQLILLCAGARVEQREERIAELLAGPLDWAYLHRAAFRNGQLPALYAQLVACGARGVPADTLQALAAFAEAQRAQNEFLLETFLGLHERFTARAIPALPYLETHFGFGQPQTSRRVVHWLDLVIGPQNLSRARELMASLGWRELLPFPQMGEAGPALAGFTIFSGGAREISLGLYWASAPKSRGVALDLQQVWSRAAGGEIAAHRIPLLSAEDALLQLCMQNTLDLWVNLAAVCDIADLRDACPALQWTPLIERARLSGSMRALLLGLGLAQQLFAVTLPAQIAKLIEQDRGLAAIAQEVTANLFDDAPASNRTPQTLRFHLRTRDGFRGRLRYLWRFAATPTEADWKLARLPASLSFLYYALRPARLAGAALPFLFDRPLRKLTQRPRSFSGYSPSGKPVVQRMLELAEVTSADVVYDLGCGDGRIVIEAARQRGARGVGIDLDAQRIRECEENARHANVENKVRFHHGDAMSADFSEATVVMMYLPPQPSLRLCERLLGELPAGARIVSHNIALNGWDRVEVCEDQGAPSLLYLRRVGEPAVVIHSTARRQAGGS